MLKIRSALLFRYLYRRFSGIGRCQFGIRRCNDGVLAETCEGALGIGEEEILGNYIDDDCDGSVDEGGVCTAGDSRPCLLGFVDDVENPDEEARQAASELALGLSAWVSALFSEWDMAVV